MTEAERGQDASDTFEAHVELERHEHYRGHPPDTSGTD